MDEEKFILEHYPDHIQERMANQENERTKNAPAYINNKAFALVIEDLKLWRVGTLKVSFKNGSSELHRKIAETANIWAQYGNIEFDFGYNSSTGKFRTWHHNDESHIRVGFDYNGYWSLVGNDSNDPQIIKPGEVTLNLSNFDKDLPLDWKATVLHEFGHALGFHHEHQSQDIECDFNWSLLYDYLGKPPNNWSPEKVDHNMRQLKGDSFTYGAHDKNSIMHYSFPSWMFLSKESSPCFTFGNETLSSQDKEMMKRAYPFSVDEIFEMDKMRIRDLEALTVIDSLPRNVSKLNQIHLEFYKQNQQ